jgi:hypothetical protein
MKPDHVRHPWVKKSLHIEGTGDGSVEKQWLGPVCICLGNNCARLMDRSWIKCNIIKYHMMHAISPSMHHHEKKQTGNNSHPRASWNKTK